MPQKQERPLGQEDYDSSKYLRDADLTGLLREQDPGVLRVARKILPRGVEDLLSRFGWQEIPQGEFPIGEGELVTSLDESAVGFQPGDVPGLCGIAVTPGEASQIGEIRARTVRPDEAAHHRVNVPEGPYQLVLLAPQPWTDPETKEIVYYTAQAMVASLEDPVTAIVKGSLTTFGRDRKPIGWMILNEWSQQGALKCAFRHVPGIVFPEKAGETEAPVLKLHSLAEERAEEIPDDVVSGSGLIAVRFSESRIDTTGRRRGGIRAQLPLIFFHTLQFTEAGLTRSLRGVYRDGGGGLTVFEQSKTTAYGVEGGRVLKPIGPTVFLSVVSSPEIETASVLFEDVRLKEHRHATDKYPSLQALTRWGFGKAGKLVPRT